MKKSNSKQLYKLARRLRTKENIPTLDDSLEIPPPPTQPKKKPSHFRSQSCPYTAEQPCPDSSLRQRQSNLLAAGSVSSHNKKPSHQSSLSQASMSSQTVIIRDLPPSDMVRRGRARELLKKSMANFKNDNYARTRVNQQIRTYELRHELENIEKESQSTSIKQRILESILLHCQPEILEHSFEFA